MGTLIEIDLRAAVDQPGQKHLTHHAHSYYPAFDYLRFVLANVVIASHLNIIEWEHAGNLAVQIFFALSGWLIGGILVTSDRSSLPKFYFNRATRIWIPYLLSVALLFGLSAIKERISWRWLEFLLYDVTFTFNWFDKFPTVETAFAEMPLHGIGGHFWSISAEEQFYLLAPIMFVVLSGVGRSIKLWTVICLVLIATRADFASISLGAFAALCEGTSRLNISNHLRTISIVVVASGLMLPVLYWLAAPVFAIAIVLLLARTGEQSVFGTFLGGVSYPLYLNHWLGTLLAFTFARRFDIPSFGATLAVLFSIAIGSLMYLLVDRNIIKYRSSFFTRERGIVAMIAGYSLVGAGITFGLMRWFVFTN